LIDGHGFPYDIISKRTNGQVVATSHGPVDWMNIDFSFVESLEPILILEMDKP
jgi:hypothetical protein